MCTCKLFTRDFDECIYTNFQSREVITPTNIGKGKSLQMSTLICMS